MAYPKDELTENVVFMTDTTTKQFQYRLDCTDDTKDGIYELTITAIDNDNSHKDYVLSCTGLQLQTLRYLIDQALHNKLDMA